MAGFVLASTAVIGGIFFILPALAGNNGDKVPPQSGVQLVTPEQVQYGGNTFPCSQYSSSANVGFQINNPKNGTFAVPGANFSITLNNVTKTSADWSTSNNFRILDLGVNGGSFTAWYRYEPPRIPWPNTSNPTLSNGLAASGATSDTGVHATEKSAGVLYNLSYMTFCYAAPTASISGTVFGDSSNDGVQDAGETGLPGRTVKLLNSSGTTLLATAPATDGTGAFSFMGVTTGQSYLVCIDAAAGYKQTLPKTGSTDLASCSAVSGARANGYGFSLVAAGRSGLLFGEVQTASISGTVFNDSSNNGALDQGEGGLAGRTVRLLNGAGTTVLATAPMTGSTGGFTFADQPVGQSYLVCVDAAAGYKQTLPKTGTTDLASCSAVSGARANGYGFSLAAAGRSDLLFGEVQTVTLSGTVYKDVNFDDATTPPPGSDDTLYTAGVTVRAFQSGVEVANAQSNGSGAYQLTLPVGSYVICVDTIATYGQTYPSGGNINVTPNVPATSGSTGCNTAWAGSVSNQGWSVTLSAATSGKDFAFVPGAEPICTAPQSTHPNYQIQLAQPCKPGQTFLVNYSDGDGSRIASVTPVRNDLPRIPMVEKITWSLPMDGHQLKLVYDDVLPYGVHSTLLPGDGPIDALTCKLDPRVGEFGLAAAYDSYGAESDAVLRTGQTSCLIHATTSTIDGLYVAYIYSAIDGWRSTP